MPKRNVYFPDDLDKAMRERPDLPIATICQDAVREALGKSTEEDAEVDPVVEARRLVRRADRLLTQAVKEPSNT